MIASESNRKVDRVSSQKQVSTLNNPRNVTFLAESDWHKPKEAYSGMWWQTTEHFLKSEWVHFDTLEIASFKAFRGGRVRKTRDWLDLSVTHLSGYYKHFMTKDQDHENESIALAHIGNHLDDYVNKTAIQYQVPAAEASAAPDTLAVLPFVAISQDTSDLVNKALNATLASLWQAGIGRCVVVVGGSHQLTLDAETNLVESIFETMQDKLDQSPMQLGIVAYDSLPKKDRLMMPRVALRGLQLAMRGNLSLSETNEWLGEEDWKYVLFTEPDLVLHARPSAMTGLKREMDRGSVLSGHRFQPIPHQSNLPDYRRPDHVLPSDFSEVIEVDPLSEDQSCCDAGKYYLSNSADRQKPLRNNRACKGKRALWWQCGFGSNYTNTETARHNHGNIREYPLLRIKGGTVFPLIDSHQRTCIFSKSSTTCLTYIYYDGLR
jgi:hypothetical protein